MCIEGGAKSPDLGRLGREVWARCDGWAEITEREKGRHPGHRRMNWVSSGAGGVTHGSALQQEGTRGCRDPWGRSRGNGAGPASWICNQRGTQGPCAQEGPEHGWNLHCCHTEILNNVIFELGFCKWNLVGQWSLSWAMQVLPIHCSPFVSSGQDMPRAEHSSEPMMWRGRFRNQREQGEHVTSTTESPTRQGADNPMRLPFLFKPKLNTEQRQVTKDPCNILSYYVLPCSSQSLRLKRMTER